MLIRIPPGSGIPFGEIVILLFLATIFLDIKQLPKFARSAPLGGFIVWWGLGAISIYIGVNRYGIWALRDANHVIESTFIWIGFVLAARPMFIDRFFKWLGVVTNVAVVYGLTYPFRETLQGLSPKITATAGYQTSIFFAYINTPVLMLMAAFRWIVERKRNLLPVSGVILGTLVIIYIVGIFQSRTIYLQVIALLLLLLWMRQKSFLQLSGTLVLGVLVVALLLGSGLEVSGRLGERVSFDFFIQHFYSIIGIEGEGAIRGAARGVSQRFGWWALIWDQLTSSVSNFLFGLGHGMPLIDFQIRGGVTVREPHNSVMSIIGRMGFVGLMVFMWIHFHLLRAWLKTFRFYKKDGNQTGQNQLLVLLVFFILVWVFSIGEDAFEKPYNTIPYYFFWGVVLRMYYDTRPKTSLRGIK